MGIELHLTAPLDPDALSLLRCLLGLPDPAETTPSWANAFLERIALMSGSVVDTIAALQTRIQENTDVTQSAATLIRGFHQMLTDAVAAARLEGATPAMLQSLTALADQVAQNDSNLADAIKANTDAHEATQQPAEGTQPPAGGQAPAEGQGGPSGSLEPAA